MTDSHIPDALVRLTQALCESVRLRSWFLELATLPFSSRVSALRSITSGMRDEGQDEAMIDAVRSLAQPGVFRAVLTIVEDSDD